METLIYPCLWFDGNASEAAHFYCSVFKKGKITDDTPVVSNVELFGQRFMCLNGGSKYKPNASISFYVILESSDEVQDAWQQLCTHGSVKMQLGTYDWSEQYGWVEDQYGVNWQLAKGDTAEVKQQITPVLMFTKPHAGKTEEAINFYTSIFDQSSVHYIMRYSASDPDVEGTIKHARFQLNHNPFMAMDSSLDHGFTFNEGVSLVVQCADQREIDYYWEKLTQGGEESMCGWLRDKYGVSWQIVPKALGDMMSNPARSQKVMEAFLQMRKFDLKKLEEAYTE